MKKKRLRFLIRNKGKIIIFSISIAFIILTIYLFYYTEQTPLITHDQVTTSDHLIKPLQLSISNIENHNSVFFPYDQNKMNVIKNKLSTLDSTDLKQLIGIAGHIPNHNFDYYPIMKLYKPINTTGFQFTKGSIGWYWCYGTSVQKNKYFSFMFYIVRVDLAPKSVLDKIGYKLGEATLYYISAGIGNGTDWYYSPFTVEKATSKCDSTGQTLTWDKNSCSLSTNGELEINYTFNYIARQQSTLRPTISPKDTCKINVTLTKTIPAYFNGKNGEAPNFGGAGTNYWSYPSLAINAQKSYLTFPKAQGFTQLTGGIGWLDHEWFNTYPKQRFTQLIATVMQKTKQQNNLGRYIWLNLHPTKGILKGNHYMIGVVNFSDINLSVTTNQLPLTRKAFFNKYNKTNSSLGNNCSVTLQELHKPLIQYSDTNNNPLGSVMFPKQYKIEIDGKNYILDSANFGPCYTLDLTGNFHFSGSAILYEADGKTQIGTGFMEANQFQSHKVYTKTSLSLLDLDNHYTDFQNPIGGKTMSYFVLICWVLLIISILICIFKIIKYLIKKNKK